jgi:hypothetical protein
VRKNTHFDSQQVLSRFYFLPEKAAAIAKLTAQRIDLHAYFIKHL